MLFETFLFNHVLVVLLNIRPADIKPNQHLLHLRLRYSIYMRQINGAVLFEKLIHFIVSHFSYNKIYKVLRNYEKIKKG